MARHRSPGGRVPVSAYLPTPDARRMHDEGRHSTPSSVTATSYPAPCPEADAPAPAVVRAPAPSYRAAPGARMAPAVGTDAPTVAYAANALSAPSVYAPTAPSATTVTTSVTAIRPVGNRRAIHRRISTTTSKGNTVVSATAALGAVVTGGLMASQATGTLALADASDAGHANTTMMAASAITPLELQPASQESPLSTSDLTDANAVTAILPVSGARDSSVDQRDVEALHRGEQLAAQAAALHSQAVKEAHILNGGGDLDDWISVALSKLNLDQSYASGVKKVIMKESRGNPHAINGWDANAAAGRPSQGLMQVIPSTFRAYVLPELKGRPITDPVANITAGIRYMIANYGAGTLRSGGRYVGGSYVGY